MQAAYLSSSSRLNWFAARIHQQKAAGAICILGFAGREASLSHQRRLLVAQNSRDRHILHRIKFCDSVCLAAGSDRWKNISRYSVAIENLRVPLERREVHQLRSARIGHVRRVNAAARPAG